MLPRATASLWASHAPLAERAHTVLTWWYTLAVTTLKVAIHIAKPVRWLPPSLGHVPSWWAGGKLGNTGFLISRCFTNSNWRATLGDWRLRARALGKFASTIKFISIECCLRKGLRSNLPLPHLWVSFLIWAWLSFFGVFYLLLEPIHVIWLLHYNLDTGAGHVQLVVNCVEKLGLSINTHFLAALPREWGAHLLLESRLAARAAASS